jgi:D-alanine-D-alanine ligase
MVQKVRVGLVCGGISSEHEVSLASCKNVLAAIDRVRYEPVPIYIDKQGLWHLLAAQTLLEADSITLLREGLSHKHSSALIPTPGARLGALSQGFRDTVLDVVFPLLHGPFGEDGTIQGMLKLLGMPFVGAGVLASAVGMDKEIMKRLLKEAGLPIARFQVLRKASSLIDVDALIEKLSLPLFVKPASLGSSIGIRKAKTRAELIDAIDYAFEFDVKILVEEYVCGREIECAVLGNQDLQVSLPGEVRYASKFYTYESKYLDTNLILEIPAPVSYQVIQAMQALAKATFQTLSCAGMARVDFFLKPNEELIINEINTIPGFTATSMYPRLWAASGLSYTELIDKLIRLALDST